MVGFGDYIKYGPISIFLTSVWTLLVTGCVLGCTPDLFCLAWLDHLGIWYRTCFIFSTYHGCHGKCKISKHPLKTNKMDWMSGYQAPQIGGKPPISTVQNGYESRLGDPSNPQFVKMAHYSLSGNQQIMGLHYFETYSKSKMGL